MFKILFSIIYIGLFILLVNCKGSDGNVGPVGPQGEKGDTGVAGANAASALIYSSGADTTDAKGMLTMYINDLTAEQEKVWNTSVILAYIKTSGIYYSMPGNVIFGQDVKSEFNFYYGIADKTFYAEMPQKDWTGKTDTTKIPPVRIVEDLRIVVIPAKIARLNASVNLKNYTETVKALGLVEKNVKTINTK